MKIGLSLHPERGLTSVMDEARIADTQGYDSIWLGDHLMSGRGSYRGPDIPEGPLDAFTLMTALGAVTTRTRLAWSMLNISFRYPAMLAKVLATLDQITKGRVICSVGSGSFPEEYRAYNIPILEDHDERVGYTREVVSLLKELWTHPAPEKVTFRGKHVQVQDLAFNPAPYQKPHPPIWIGGESEATIQIVKDLADGWVTLSRNTGTDRGDAGDKVQQALASPDWPDRPMTVVRQVRIIVAESRDAAIAIARKAPGVSAEKLEEFMSNEIVGDPQECLERIAAQEAAGCNYLRVTFDDLAQQERVARLLLPRIGAVQTAR